MEVMDHSFGVNVTRSNIEFEFWIGKGMVIEGLSTYERHDIVQNFGAAIVLTSNELCSLYS